MPKKNDAMPPQRASRSDRLFAALQHMLPTHLLSNLVFRLTRIRQRWIAQTTIRLFMRAFQVSLSDARQDITRFECFNDFFTRALRSGARPLPPEHDIVISPVDGCVSQCGPIDGDALLQTKGRHYTASALLGGADFAARFHDGRFCTLYLAPADYHRVHAPCAMRLRATRLIPGRLFSVNPATTRTVDRLFARNERLVCLFDTEFGSLALVMVGAMLVGSIETVWSGRQTPPRATRIHTRQYDGPEFERGAEIGRFNMGSSVIVLLPSDSPAWNSDIRPGQAIKMGQALSRV